MQSLKEAGIVLTDFQKGNEKARERMKVQFSIASNRQGIVVGTDHSAENITGFIRNMVMVLQILHLYSV